MAEQEQEIRIFATPQADGAKCDFAIDRKVVDGVVWFGSRESAAGSPLAERLFALEGVKAVLLRDNVVTVTREGMRPWEQLAKEIGTTIRTHLQEGGPAVQEGLLATGDSDEDLLARVRGVVEDQINPAVAAHGGFIEITGVRGGVVFLRMGGGCQGCASSQATLRMGVEQSIRQAVPDVVEIVDATDHMAGDNPYYR